jgi:predicted CopG family antitoxin
MTATIKVSKDNHSRLEKAGLKGETFDDIISRLLDVYEQAKFVGKLRQ